MTLELVSALLLGALVLWIVLAPLTAPRRAARAPDGLDDALPLEETRRGQALIALKELDFDLATGKLSDVDYGTLRQRYVADAVEAMRREPDPIDPAEALVAQRAAALAAVEPAGVTCAVCGPRPEADALYCSSCGAPLPAPAGR